MNIYLPFTYVLTFKPTGQRYYGVRYAKNAHPSQLWTTYFTSSKAIKTLIKDHGVEAFDVLVRRTFKSKESAVLWESKVLRRLDASHSSKWINRINGDANFASISKWSEEAKIKLSNSRKGIKFSKEHRNNLSKSHIGYKQSEETKNKRSQALIGRVRPPRSTEWKAKISEGQRRRHAQQKIINTQ
jgi:hypothetical protein